MNQGSARLQNKKRRGWLQRPIHLRPIEESEQKQKMPQHAWLTFIVALIIPKRKLEDLNDVCSWLLWMVSMSSNKIDNKNKNKEKQT